MVYKVVTYIPLSISEENRIVYSMKLLADCDEDNDRAELTCQEIARIQKIKCFVLSDGKQTLMVDGSKIP